MGKIGLVFEGGGGKGAYQIGCWRAIRALGLEASVTSVSGTSVGALNAALFAQGDFSKAQQVWAQLTPDKIITPSSVEQISEFLSKLWTHKRLFKTLLAVSAGVVIPATLLTAPVAIASIPVSKFLTSGLTSIPLAKGTTPLFTTALHANPVLLANSVLLSPFIKTALVNGALSQSGLRDMIQSSLDLSQVSRSKISCCATCCKLPKLSLKRFALNGMYSDDIKSVLLASSAIPIVFPMTKVQGHFYYDGGIPKFGDNTPIQPLLDRGLDTIIVLHLSAPNNSTPLHTSEKVMHIYPSDDLGGFASGTLDFTADGAARRMELGYYDAMNTLTHADL